MASFASGSESRDLNKVIKEYGWSESLKEVITKSLPLVRKRYFICDDSGSMCTEDGNVITNNNGVKKFESCSRFQELASSMQICADLSFHSDTDSQFRFLNCSETFDTSSESNYHDLKAMFHNEPDGGTPLCEHILAIIEDIKTIADELKATNKKVCVVIATDGESSDGDICEAMRELEDLPCWVVIRLCTDEEEIVSYWNDIDSKLELHIDVLDDIVSEAKEIEEKNSWFVYGEDLHRLREFGIPMPEVDLLDESALAPEQIFNIIKRFVHGANKIAAQPLQDPEGYLAELEQLVADEKCRVWCPIQATFRPIINVSALKTRLEIAGFM